MHSIAFNSLPSHLTPDQVALNYLRKRKLTFSSDPPAWSPSTHAVLALGGFLKMQNSEIAHDTVGDFAHSRIDMPSNIKGADTAVDKHIPVIT